MSDKIFRDPLYNYISIDQNRDAWLLRLIDTPEVQRLRRIHQLGVSSFTYPGAEHSRLSHSLGVVHLMTLVLSHLERDSSTRSKADDARRPLLAAALLHDVGHGPFSHLFEPLLDINHESWSLKLIRDTNSNINHVLAREDSSLVERVARLIETDNLEAPAWQRSLLSSELDVDRMDYLRRDSLFSGAGYGNFDWYRLISTMRVDTEGDEHGLMWDEKAKFAIEEFIFARYYMYQNVYLHKTTRGFEAVLKAMWDYAGRLSNQGVDCGILPAIVPFWSSAALSQTTSQYLRLEECDVVAQIKSWAQHSDKTLSDLAYRFLNRDGFAMIEAPRFADTLDPDYSEFENDLRTSIAKMGFMPVECYCLTDTLKKKYRTPYRPEKESQEQTARNAIRMRKSNGSIVEITRELPRLRAVTEHERDGRRYYVPKKARQMANELAVKHSQR